MRRAGNMVVVFLSFDSERMAQEPCRIASFLKVRSRENAMMRADSENDKSYDGIE
jgi:hypothetical protein